MTYQEALLSNYIRLDRFVDMYICERASLVVQLVKNLPAMQEILVQPWVRKSLWRRDQLPIPVFLDFPGGSDGKETDCDVGDLGFSPGLGSSRVIYD